jgi:hypothetical protein
MEVQGVFHTGGLDVFVQAWKALKSPRGFTDRPPHAPRGR